MKLRLPSRKTVIISIASLMGLIAAWLLFAWLALPRILQYEAERYIAEKTGHRLTLDRPEFNPFKLLLRVPNLRLADPAGKPLLAFRELDVDLSAASLYRDAFVFDGIRLVAPEATVVLRRDGRLNWSPLFQALAGKGEKPRSSPPRFDIRSFVLSGGGVDFADERAGFSTRIAPVDVELHDVSTLPDGHGRYQLAARTTLGARILWQGEGRVEPLAIVGRLRVDALDLARLSPYLKGILPTAPPAGIVSLATDYRLGYADGRIDATLDDLHAEGKGLRLASGHGPLLSIATLAAKQGRFDLGSRQILLGSLTLSDAALAVAHAGKAPPPLHLGGATVEDVAVDLAGRTARIARIALQDGDLRATRDHGGQLDLLADVRAFAPPAQPKASSASPPWHYRIGQIELRRFAASLRDDGVTPPAVFAIADAHIRVDHVSDDRKAPLTVDATLRAKGGGTLEASGEVVPAGPTATFQVKLSRLALQPIQPYLSAVARLRLVRGALSGEGRAEYGKAGARFQGGFALDDLRLNETRGKAGSEARRETDTGRRFLAWKSLATRSLYASPREVLIRRLDLVGLDTSLLIAADKSVNLTRILRHHEQATAPASPAAAPAPRQRGQAPPFLVKVDRLRVVNGALDFADRSLALPFGTRIHRLYGNLNGLSSRAGAPGQLELQGQVDEYGLARAAGQLEFFAPTRFLDIKVAFRNIEMTRLTPYSATFAGRKINSGKLSMDLEYKLDHGQLVGDNRIIMDRLTLGERVKSPQAKDLPLDLAIAVLEDSNGRIDLGLPVSGNLDDPHFQFGSIIWKAIVNVITKIATAPFRALASLFGGGQHFENIAFEAGSPRLLPPEREKLVRLAEALDKRPGLALAVHGVYADADRRAIQDLQARRAVARQAGQRIGANEDPGPLSTHDPRIQSAIEDLFRARFGGGELAALKEGFRQANPGQLPESVAGKMLSRLSDLFRKRRTLRAGEVSQLKGADFYAVLFDRLRAREVVPDERLQALAKTRGENTVAALRKAGAPADRLTLEGPEKVEAVHHEVPVRLVLRAARR